MITKLPASLSALTNLKILNLGSNIIDDNLPIAQVCGLSNIKIFDIGNSTLSGSFDSCLGQINPIVFDVSAPHPGGLASGKGFGGEFPFEITSNWTDLSSGYLSIYGHLGMSGRIARSCYDVRFCYPYMFTAHGDLSWANTLADVPDVVIQTISLAT